MHAVASSCLNTTMWLSSSWQDEDHKVLHMQDTISLHVSPHEQSTKRCNRIHIPYSQPWLVLQARKKKRKKSCSLCPVSNCIFFFSLPSIIPNLNLIGLRIPPLNSAAKNCNEYLQLLLPHTKSLCVLACTLLLFIHMICRSPPSKKRIDATIK